MTESSNQTCHSCGTTFAGFKGLAQHIVSKKDPKHKKGKRWAHRFLMKQKFLDQKKDLKPRSPMPESVKSHFDEIKRETSGETIRVLTHCPNCKMDNVAVLEAEYVQSGVAWTKDKRLVLLCNGCRR